MNDGIKGRTMHSGNIIKSQVIFFLNTRNIPIIMFRYSRSRMYMMEQCDKNITFKSKAKRSRQIDYDICIVLYLWLRSLLAPTWKQAADGKIYEPKIIKKAIVSGDLL